MARKWRVEFHQEFVAEFRKLPVPVQDELFAHAQLLETLGPSLGRPAVDTLKGSRHTNMKELRFSANRGVWRAAFAFDSARRAIVLVAGDKRGANEQRFYRRLIRTADRRFESHQREQQGGQR